MSDEKSYFKIFLQTNSVIPKNSRDNNAKPFYVLLDMYDDIYKMWHVSELNLLVII